MRRHTLATLTALALTAGIITASNTPTAAAADECTYNRVIALAATGQTCTELLFVVALPGDLTNRYPAVYTDPTTGDTYNATCARNGYQVLCELGTRINTPPDTYTDTAGNTCTNVKNAASQVIDIVCTKPVTRLPTISFTG